MKVKSLEISKCDIPSYHVTQGRHASRDPVTRYLSRTLSPLYKDSVDCRQTKSPDKVKRTKLSSNTPFFTLTTQTLILQQIKF